MNKLALLMAIFLIFNSSVLAQEKELESTQEEAISATAETQSVEINGTKDPDWKSYAKMLKGIDAFDKHRGLAPQAPLKFILKPRKAGVSMDGLSLRLENGDQIEPIPLASDGTFTLPRSKEAVAEKAELVINRKKALFRWWPQIRTAGLLENQRRLGDLRLECELFWAINYDDIPFLVRGLIRVMGVNCQSNKVELAFPSDYLGLVGAKIVQGERSVDLKLSKDKTSYNISLYEGDFNNDAIVELIYDEEIRSQKKTNYTGMRGGIK